MGLLSQQQLNEMGFNTIGNNVRISDKASIYGADKINIGNNVRIDDFCVLSAGFGGIIIGDFVHIAVYSSIIGAGEIFIDDFSNISSRVSIYSSNDDYSGAFMTNPMVPENYTNVTSLPVHLGKHVIIGSGSVVLPGVNIETGAAIGALSLVKNSCSSFNIYAGNPAIKIKERKRDLLIIEGELKSTLGLAKR